MHGGGFYQMHKFVVAPDYLPDEPDLVQMGGLQHLASGFCLLILVYYVNAELLPGPTKRPSTRQCADGRRGGLTKSVDCGLDRR